MFVITVWDLLVVLKWTLVAHNHAGPLGVVAAWAWLVWWVLRQMQRQ